MQWDSSLSKNSGNLREQVKSQESEQVGVDHRGLSLRKDLTPTIQEGTWYSDLSNNHGGWNKRGDSNKACSWDFSLKKNKKNSMLIRDFRVCSSRLLKLGKLADYFSTYYWFRCHYPLITRYHLRIFQQLDPQTLA